MRRVIYFQAIALVANELSAVATQASLAIRGGVFQRFWTL